jgi:hypothetical protein|tara:strand:+ start:1853 stop:1984 length:132 start_codon:yes stop_codon:yes gene_type:complete
VDEHVIEATLPTEVRMEVALRTEHVIEATPSSETTMTVTLEEA